MMAVLACVAGNKGAARKLGDKRVLRLLRRHLRAELMLGGLETVQQSPFQPNCG
jgi:hypothetical protein